MFLGIDLGTSEVKLLLLDDTGRIVGTAGGALSLSNPEPLWSEQAPTDWWQALEAAIARLRAAGVRVGALTNIWPMPDRDADLAALKRGFDQAVESFRVGMRKPESRIYELACRKLDVSPADAIFLDDLGTNLKTARALGMATIKVGDPAEALAELERLTGVALQAPTGR